MNDNIREVRHRDITDDFLLCNRCGTCRSVCPLFTVLREEWAAARGKVELAEAFFRDGKLDPAKIQEIFDLCLHCMTCEENCPSGMRPDEIVMAVRAEIARRGLLPRIKRIAFRMLEGMDGALFKLMRAVGLARRRPLHGTSAKSPLNILFPLFGWERERFFPLPARRPFLSGSTEFYGASDLEVTFEELDSGAETPAGAVRTFDPRRALRLRELIESARERNLEAKKRAYFFVGHAVNHFFPEEAEAVVRLLNILGVDVIAPKDQVCCGAPIYYAGDIDGARKAAAASIEKFAGHRYDYIVTSCSSGGLMLKGEMKRLFDITADGYFEIEWDPDMETFRRMPGPNHVQREYPHIADLYREYVEGKVYDINELVAELLGLGEERHVLEKLFGEIPARGIDGTGEAGSAGSEWEPADAAGADKDHAETPYLPVVTYHHPCHLKRGQGVGWQPEALLRRLPGHRYVPMKDSDRCCGGGGSFTFLHSEAAEEVARPKMDAVEALRPDVLATACPICRIQLMDMLNRRFVLGREAQGKSPRRIPVKTPVELMLEDLTPILRTTRITSW
jgi:glycolate oxidase iron-sulfur subunit